MGVVIDVGLAVSVVGLVGVIAGWIYGAEFHQLRATCSRGCITAIHPSALAWIAPGAILGASVVLGVAWVLRRWPRRVAVQLQRYSVWGLIASAVVATLTLAVPQILAWLHRASIP